MRVAVLLNRITTVQECDATKADSSNTADTPVKVL